MKKILLILFLFPLLLQGQIVYTALTEQNSNSVTTTFNTPSYTPTTGALVLAFVTSAKATTPDIPTFSGNGLTWVQIETETLDVIATPTKRITAFRAMGTASTGAATATFANAQDGCQIIILQFTGTDISGSNGSGAIVQAVKSNADATSNPSITMGAISSVTNSVVAFYATDDANIITAPEAGWTPTTNVNRSVPDAQLYGEYRLTTTDNTPTVTAASSDWAGIAIEIKSVARRRIIID
jgi:hypothetical protein